MIITEKDLQLLQNLPVKEEHSLQEKDSILNIEFDGTTVLCRVCGDKASGFHYGVHSCEGCKGFFRRSIQQKIQYRPCTKNQQCAILRINRNRCQYCRLKKCIAVGMSRDAVRFGRVPKREKAKILAAMQSVQNKSQEKALSAELEDGERLVGTIIQAHLDTCDFTKDKISPLLQRAQDSPVYTSCPPTLACPLNPNPQPLHGQQQLLQDFSERFSPAIRGVVEFAKRIPGFSLLSQDDQVTLLKAGVFEVLLIRLACMFDSHTNTMLCLNGQVLRRESIHHSSNARFLMDSMFDFAERLNSLGLTDAELGLFSSVVVITPDRPGLRNVDLVDKMNRKLSDALGRVLADSHPHDAAMHQELMKKVPDLRTLNTLHSEKLLAFKMTEQQQQQQQQQYSIDNLYSQSCNNYWVDSKFEPASVGPEDEMKSPYSCVSSADSVCSGDMFGDLRHSGLPVGGLPKRKRDISQCEGTSSGDEGDSPRKCPYKACKVDSPSDSGIESGNEKFDKLSSRSGSLCSSPRSTLDDRVKDIVDTDPLEHSRREVQPSPTSSSSQPHSDDMPVLKRALQAPPLINTNLLMTEAYRNIPHKKFRAAFRKDSVDLEVSPREAGPHHSMLAQSLMEGPKLTMEQQKRSDYLHNMIMRSTDSSSDVSQSSHPSSTYYVLPSRSISPSLSWRTVSSTQNTPSTTCRVTSQSLPHQSGGHSPYYVAQELPRNCSPFRTSPAVVELQVDVNGESQPLNLSKKPVSQLKLCLEVKSEN